MNATASPKKRNRHYSYDDSLDEGPKPLEEESVEVEKATPAEQNGGIERDDEDEEPNTPVVEG